MSGRDDFDRLCLGLPAATMDIQWGDDRVYKVGGKMFAVIGPDDSCSFKVSDVAYEALTETGQAKPAPYMARAKWVAWTGPEAVPDLEGYLRDSHAMVAAKLTRKQRAELGL